MIYVYFLQSIAVPDRFYTGIARNLRARLKKHNSGDVSRTSKFKPWRVNAYLGFFDEKRAFDFEKYLKSASGRAFAKKGL